MAKTQYKMESNELKEHMTTEGRFLWWIAYRPSLSHEEWKLQGEMSSEPFRSYQTAEVAMEQLSRNHFYDVMLMPCVRSIQQ